MLKPHQDENSVSLGSSRRRFLKQLGVTMLAAFPAVAALGLPQKAAAVECCVDVTCSWTGETTCDGGGHRLYHYICNDAHGCGWCYDEYRWFGEYC
jgi:hypothetical protein